MLNQYDVQNILNTIERPPSSGDVAYQNINTHVPTSDTDAGLSIQNFVQAYPQSQTVEGGTYGGNNGSNGGNGGSPSPMHDQYGGNGSGYPQTDQELLTQQWVAMNGGQYGGGDIQMRGQQMTQQLAMTQQQQHMMTSQFIHPSDVTSGAQPLTGNEIALLMTTSPQMKQDEMTSQSHMVTNQGLQQGDYYGNQQFPLTTRLLNNKADSKGIALMLLSDYINFSLHYFIAF